MPKVSDLFLSEFPIASLDRLGLAYVMAACKSAYINAQPGYEQTRLIRIYDAAESALANM